MTDTIEKPRVEKLTEPSRAWVNWWLPLIKCHEVGGRRLKPGQKYPAPYVWPSKEVAEQKAEECLAEDIERFGVIVVEYLGAFAEGTRP